MAPPFGSKTQTSSGTRKTAIRAVRIGEILGAAPRCPTIFNSAKALEATHAAGIGERPVQLRLADRSPVAQPVERPTLDREVDGANPSGAATHRRAHRAASRAGRSIADRRTDIAEAGGAEPPRRTIFQRSRSSMYRAPRFERGGCRRNSCQEHHFSPCSPTRRGTCFRNRPVRSSIWVMTERGSGIW